MYVDKYSWGKGLFVSGCFRNDGKICDALEA